MPETSAERVAVTGQHAVRGAATLCYDMAGANLDRHAAHAVAAYLAGMSAD